MALHVLGIVINTDMFEEGLVLSNRGEVEMNVLMIVLLMSMKVVVCVLILATMGLLTLHVVGIVIYADPCEKGMKLSDVVKVGMMGLLMAMMTFEPECADPRGKVDTEPWLQDVGGKSCNRSGDAKNVVGCPREAVHNLVERTGTSRRGQLVPAARVMAKSAMINVSNPPSIYIGNGVRDIAAERNLVCRVITYLRYQLMPGAGHMAKLATAYMANQPRGHYTLEWSARFRLLGESLEVKSCSRRSRARFRGSAFHCLPTHPWQNFSEKLMP